MAWLKELVRVVNGLSAVAKEAVRRSESADFKLESLIKRSIVSVTDLAGLTKGTPRTLENKSSSSHYHHSHPPTTTDTNNTYTTTAGSITQIETTTGDTNKESVVFFNYGNHQPPQDQVQSESRHTNVYNEYDSVIKDAADAANQDLSTSVDAADVTTTPPPSIPSSSSALVSNRQRKPRERKVPSTPFSRALGFAGLGAGLAWGTLQESARRLVFGMPSSQEKQSAFSPYLSEKNAERLALALCRMRGAALKLGQMLSIQDESLVPAPILAALDIVRQGADVMPRSQLNQVLDAELGPDWSSKLTCFDYEPMAAASIGQVHRAVTKDGLEVAMKIQYPGVADSIESDIENLKLLLKYTNLIPEKLYLDNAMKVAKEELSRECNYELEAENQKRFRYLLSDAEGFYVPLVVEDLSSKRILTTELVPGIPIDKVTLLDQEIRNYVGKKLLELTLMELFSFRFMQTDPNWSNFLYNKDTKSINLIDFGAARDYPKHFVDNYLRMVLACANSDCEAVIEMSKRLGFLTGSESEIMREAHVQAGFVVGLPFARPGGYDFRSTNITQSISNLGATMLRHRLTPPPEEAYSLHRKLSGAFLACIKLGAVVPGRELLIHAYENYNFGEDCPELSTSGSV